MPARDVVAGSPYRLRLATALLFLLFAGQAVRNLLDWPGFIAVTAIGLIVVLAALWRHRADSRWIAFPVELLAFLVLSAASIIWSHYPAETGIGVAAQWATALAGVYLAIALSWEQLLRALSVATVSILVLSLAFEAFVTFAIGERVAPLWTDYPPDSPASFYWSTNSLLSFGPIQGIVGNRNLLAFVALIALVTLVIRQLRATRPSARLLGGILLAVATIALTRSATIVLAAFALVVLIGLLYIVRRTPRNARGLVYAGGALVLGGSVFAALSAPHALFALVGRSDLTDRGTIWHLVLDLIKQEPLLGWGWISYWAPWVEPFAGLVVSGGVEYLQAHNAILDIWLQLGLAGGVVAIIVAVVAAFRAWQGAVYAATRQDALLAAVPLLMLAALLFQSLTESRLLIEGNWALFVAIVVKLAIDSGSESLAGLGFERRTMQQLPTRAR